MLHIKNHNTHTPVDIATQKHQSYGEKSTIRYNKPMTIPTWTLQDRIRKAREHAGLKQAALAEMIPVARNTLSRWESGAFKPSSDDLDRLAEITAVDRTWPPLSPSGGLLAASRWFSRFLAPQRAVENPDPLLWTGALYCLVSSVFSCRTPCAVLLPIGCIPGFSSFGKPALSASNGDEVSRW